MKLCVMLPALNEAATIASVIGRIPRRIPGLDEVVVLVIDDGSTDRTRELALEAGAIVISQPENMGLGMAFQTGVEKALDLESDILVNIDADGQFNPEDIPLLLQPILAGRAEFVSASRFMNPDFYPEMSRVKFWGNRMMSLLVSTLVGRRFYDVSCGFRAYARDALLRLNLFGDFTYTQETFLDLSFKKTRIVEVPVRIRGTREFGRSRIASNLFQYAGRSGKIIFRSFRDYKPMRVFGAMAAAMFLLAVVLILFLGAHYLRTGEFSPHKWAGFLAGFLFIVGSLTFITGLIADMLARQRINQERMLYLLKKIR